MQRWSIYMNKNNFFIPTGSMYDDVIEGPSITWKRKYMADLVKAYGLEKMTKIISTDIFKSAYVKQRLKEFHNQYYANKS